VTCSTEEVVVAVVGAVVVVVGAVEVEGVDMVDGFVEKVDVESGFVADNEGKPVAIGVVVVEDVVPEVKP